MMRAAKTWIALGVVAAALAGCTTVPADYAGTLSKQDPKWRSPECQKIRAEAANYKERKVYWGAGALIGPYGLALVAAAKDHQEKQRVLFARELHMRCSSQPLPRKLQGNPPARQKST